MTLMLRNRIITWLATVMTLLIAVVSPAAPQTQPQPLAKLTVKVVDLRNHKGQLIFGVFKSAGGFPTDEKKAVNWQIKPADAAEAVFSAMLPQGDYAASVLHDENKNGKMDKNFVGVPQEGYGVTNNPKPKLRAATFEEARFTLPGAGSTLTISIQYFQ